MSGEIIEFKPKKSAEPSQEQWCYECAACGAQNFTLNLGGAVSCGECSAPHPKLIWGQHFQSQKRPERNDG